ncbi:hypothetical protein EVA_04987 [gut metagenome]|uniref:Uncharacterized protein n=1 Tax=gut metagenome TaxID=749906 RepID=J9GVG9_9ZZZZ
MTDKKKAAEAAQQTYDAKVQNPKDFTRLIEYFHYKDATSLDAMLDTGILRNSITWYIAEAEKLGLLQAVFKDKDAHTGRMAKYYSSNPQKWQKSPQNKQLELFGKEAGYGI